MAAALLVAGSLAVSGCSDKKTEEPAPPAVSYGVVVAKRRRPRSRDALELSLGLERVCIR